MSFRPSSPAEFLPPTEAGRRGVLLALGAAASFALFAPLGKSLVGALPPVEVCGIAYLFSGLALLAAGGLTAGEAFGGPLKRSDLPRLGASVALGGILAPLLLLAGLREVAAYQGSLLLNLEAVFTVVCGLLIGGERLGWRGAAGAVGIVLAGVGVSMRGAPAGADPGLGAPFIGSLAIAGACLCWALDNTISRPLAERDPRQVAMIKGLLAGTMSVLLAVQVGLVRPSFLEWVGLAVSGSVALGLSLVLYLLSLRNLGIARTGAFFALSTPMSFAASVVFLGERPGFIGASALVVSALATILLATDREEGSGPTSTALDSACGSASYSSSQARPSPRPLPPPGP